MAQSYRAGCPGPQRQCVLIADDLTGACDAAVAFRSRGAAAYVHVTKARPHGFDADVLAFSTDSRDAPAAEIRRRLFEVAALTKVGNGSRAIIFKKLDSTLRGNPGVEIAAAVEAFHCEVAVIAPAFPDMGRQVRDGFLHSDRDPAWQPIHVASLLRAQGLGDCHHILPEAIQIALAGGSRFVSLDTTMAEDLDIIVAETLRCGRRVMWAGSAGLAAALARALFPQAPVNAAQPRREKPVLFAVGSNHVVTSRQTAALCQRYSVQQFHADSATPDALTSALRSNRHVLLTIGRNTTDAKRLATLLPACKDLTGALLLSGGDTASLVCEALSAYGITLKGEIVTGIPWGLLEGSVFHNVCVATKSGAFGAPHALIEVAEFFSCLVP